MRKSIVVAGTLVALVVPTTALAGAPSGTIDGIVANPNAQPNTANVVAINSSKVTQNGQWVSGHNELADAGMGNLPGYSWSIRRPTPARVASTCSRSSVTTAPPSLSPNDDLFRITGGEVGPCQTCSTTMELCGLLGDDESQPSGQSRRYDD